MNESKDLSQRSSSETNILEHIHPNNFPNQIRAIKLKTHLEVIAESEVNENILNSTDFIQSPFPNILKNQNNLARLNLQLNHKIDEPGKNGIEFAYIESKHCATEASNASSEHSTINENDHENIQTRIENYNLSPRIRLGNELFSQNHSQPPHIRPQRQDIANNRENNANNAAFRAPVRAFPNVGNHNRWLNREEFLAQQSIIEFYIFTLVSYVILYLIIKGKTTPFAEVVIVWGYALTQLATIIRFPLRDDGFPNPGSRKIFIVLDWIFIMIYAIGFALKVGINDDRKVSIILTPFCSLAALNILFFSLKRTRQARQTKKKRQALLQRILFWGQFFLISLKLDNYLNLPWTLILLVAFVTFGFFIVYSIFPLFILVTTIRMAWRGSLVAGRVSNKVKIIGLTWCVVITLSSTFWTLIIVGLARLLENENYTGLIETALRAALAHGIFLGLATFIIRQPLKVFLRAYLLDDMYGRNGARAGMGEARLEEKIEFQIVESNVPFFLTISPTFHQIWSDEIKSYDKIQKREWRKQIHQIKMAQPRIKRNVFKRTEEIKLISNKEPNPNLNNENKMSSSFEIVIHQNNIQDDVSEDYLSKINYTNNDIEIYDSVKRPSQYTEKREGDNICYICVQRAPDAVFMKCGHSGICYECAMESWKKSERCGMCRQKVENIIKVKYYEKLKLSKSIHGTKKIATLNVLSL